MSDPHPAAGRLPTQAEAEAAISDLITTFTTPDPDSDEPRIRAEAYDLVMGALGAQLWDHPEFVLPLLQRLTKVDPYAGAMVCAAEHLATMACTLPRAHRVEVTNKSIEQIAADLLDPVSFEKGRRAMQGDEPTAVGALHVLVQIIAQGLTQADAWKVKAEDTFTDFQKASQKASRYSSPD